MKGITKANRETIRLAALGYTNKQIAATRFLAEKSIEGQFYRLYRLNGISDRTVAVVMALKDGHITFEELN